MSRGVIVLLPKTLLQVVVNNCQELDRIYDNDIALEDSHMAVALYSNSDNDNRSGPQNVTFSEHF